MISKQRLGDTRQVQKKLNTQKTASPQLSFVFTELCMGCSNDGEPPVKQKNWPTRMSFNGRENSRH
jgi:hypothetical protein